MTQPQTNISLRAPGFYGLNTEDSPLDLDLNFAAEADNCIIDKVGRIGSRKGFYPTTTGYLGKWGQNALRALGEHVDEEGTSYLFLCGKTDSDVDAIWMQDQTPPYALTLMTIAGTAPSDSNWAIVSLGNRAYFAQAGHDILVFDPLVSLVALSVYANSVPPLPPPVPLSPGPDSPNILLSAIGHLWVADTSTDKQSIFISSLVDGIYLYWETLYDIAQYWPLGSDSITAMTFFNNHLLVFGKRSILVYLVPPEGPEFMTLVDTVSNMGCVSRDALIHIGNDVLFLDDTGLRSFGRTIQEKSFPIGDMSINIKGDIQAAILGSNLSNIKTVFVPEESFVLVSFPDIKTSYVFDTKAPLENGAMRPTRWPNRAITCLIRTTSGKFLSGAKGGTYFYQGSDDVQAPLDDYISSPISMTYATHPQSFGDPSRVKFLKQLDITIIGSTLLDLMVRWAYDFSTTFSVFRLGETTGISPSYYNIAMFNTEGVYYGGTGVNLVARRVNLWGSGNTVIFGFTSLVTETPLSIQELNIQALIGRML